MKFFLVTVLLLGVAHAQKSESNADDMWSWITGDKQEEQAGNGKNVRLNGENIDQVVDSILQNGRQGRNLHEFDEVYRDPAVQNAIQNGNDTTARHYIKDRLCNLGLMQCEDDVLPKRSVHPSDVIYAQPVAVKPVGHPIPAVPVRNPHHIKPSYVGPYGPPRPVPFPGKYGPPPGHSYKPYRPHGPKPYPVYEKPEYEDISGPGGIIEHEVPPPFVESGEHHKIHTDKSTVVVNTQGSSGSGVQQHVHHHYHHGAGGVVGQAGAGVAIAQKPLVVERPVIVEKPVPVPATGHGPVVGGGFGPSSGFGGAPVYESVESSGYGGSYNGIYGGHHGTYGSGSGGSYLNHGHFYKKELNLNGGGSGLSSSSSSSSSSYADGFSSYHTPRADQFERCTCVPINQCNSYDIIGRKDEGSGIDPRSNPGSSDIEAIGLDDVVITDGNGTIISHHAAAKTQAKRESEADDSSERDSAEVMDDEAKDRTKREAPGKNENGEDKSDIAPRVFKGGFQEELSKLKVSPTFGVSFGLPQSGDYPINSLTGHPIVNPYGHGLGPNGVRIGPVSVNPLVAVQVTKDEDGESVVKPLVNLHVTPTHGFIHKIGGIKHKLLHQISHDHHHHHVHTYERPHNYHSVKPLYHAKPWHEYAPSYDGYYDSDEHYTDFDFYDKYDSFGYDGYDGYDRRSGKSLNVTARPGRVDIRADDSPYDLPFSPQASHSSSSSSPSFHQPFNSIQQSSSDRVSFPRHKRDASETPVVKRQAYYGGSNGGRCGPGYVCCRSRGRPSYNHNRGQCGRRNAQGINGRIKTPTYVDGESEFGEYPWQVAILKKDPQESVYVCGGTLIDNLHIITAAHCVKTYSHYDLRVRLGEWDVNHDVEFYPYIERDVSLLQIHPEFYAGTLQNDIAILRMDKPVDLINNPHISAACLPEPHSEFAGSRCWTTGWGKDAFGDYGKYQNILKEVDVPVLSHHQCQNLLQQTRLGYDFKLHPGFVCAGGEEGKDACKGDGGGPMVCERSGTWQVVGIVSWGVGCGQSGVPGVYVKVSHYLDWIRQITNRY